MQPGKTMLLFIDDIIAKSLHANDRIKHLRQTFKLLKEYHMKLNPIK